MDITALLAGFGFAVGAGGRGLLVAALLGAFHHTPYFDLGARFDWLAAPPVLAVLAVLALAELYVEARPELSEMNDLVGYLPKFLVGFLGLAAAVGTLDGSLGQLLGSGLLGGGVAAGTHWARVRLRRVTRDTSENADGAVSGGESVAAAALVPTGIFAPLAVPLVLGLVVVGAWVAYRVGSALERKIADLVGIEEEP